MAQQVGQDLANVPFDKFIKNILLAMVEGQNAANSAFISGVEDLASKDNKVTIAWTDSSGTDQSITAPPIAYGLIPTLLQIQSGIIEIKMAITMKETTKETVGIKAHVGFALWGASVDAKYSNTYSYDVKGSSFVHIQVAPAPPPAPLMTIVQAIAKDLEQQVKVPAPAIPAKGA